jgi:hypothetical protein
VPGFLDLLHEVSIFAMLTMAVSLGAFGLGASYAIRPNDRTLVLMRPVSLAAIFAALSGLLSGWALILGGMAATPAGGMNVANVFMGLAETLTLGFICFGLLAAGWLLAAVGMLRRGYGLESATSD